jgi:hypothetical protein
MTIDANLRAQLVEALAERDALRAQLDGDLNRRVTRQRFVLRTLDSAGH